MGGGGYVLGFTKYFGKPIMVEVVHADVAHDCGYMVETYLIIIWNVLYMQSMSITLLPPFMVRLSGI